MKEKNQTYYANIWASGMLEITDNEIEGALVIDTDKDRGALLERVMPYMTSRDGGLYVAAFTGDPDVDVEILIDTRTEIDGQKMWAAARSEQAV